MQISVDNLSFNIRAFGNTFQKENTPIFFLHGFTGKADDWNFLLRKIENNFSPVAFDLIGHGKTSSPSEIDFYTQESIVEQILSIIKFFDFEKVVLCGYSMGGRAALSFAIRYPELISGLVLESSSPGIKDATEKNERKINDVELANKIISGGIENFLQYWMNLPMFESQKKLGEEKLTKLFQSKLCNNAAGLSNSLKGFGTGSMNHCWDKLGSFTFPVLLITGKLDEKFSDINSRMNDLLNFSEHIIVKDAGHNVHLEKSEEFIILINNFLKKILN